MKNTSQAASSSSLDDTQPTRIHSHPPNIRQPKKKIWWVLWGAVFALFIALSGLFGALAGSQSAQRTLQVEQTAQANKLLSEQFDLGMADLQAGRYDIARQRFEYILQAEPEYPQAASHLSTALAVLYATATPTPVPPTPTPTSPPPTRDLRPAQTLLQDANSRASNQDWNGVIEILQALRKNDPDYETASVDGLLWLALRSRGVDKIYRQANLEGGIYDLALAEAFGIIDVEAEVARNMARTYLYGLAFWEVYPEKAVYYFGLVYAAMPGLRDSSGFTAAERYFASLVQYGDQLFNQRQWCEARAQYELAASIRPGEVAERLQRAIELCLVYTPTPPGGAGTPTDTPTATQTQAGEPSPTATSTPPAPPTNTHTPTQPAPPPATASPTPTATATQPAPPSDTPPPPPSDTPQPTVTPTDGLSSENTQSDSSALPWLLLPFFLAAMSGPGPQRRPAPATTPRSGWLRRAGLFTALSILLIVSMALSGWGAFVVSRRWSQSWADFVSLSGPSISRASSTAAAATPSALFGEVTPLSPAQVEIAASLKPWDGAGRVTILLLGVDFRDWSMNEPASRSDTMILLTLDPQAKTAGVLSVPRDMWVHIPGFKHGKINTAYYLGDIYKLPGGGPALAVKTVEQLLGVEINYFAQIDFSAFVRFIDEIGGVVIDVPEPITIDLLGSGFRTKKTLQAGRQALPGEWALAYARARHTEGGDFDRAFRQQQVIMAIRERMLTADGLQTMIRNAPALYSELASGIRTNLTLDQVIQLALLAQSVPDQAIQRGIIGKESVFFGQSPDGLAILIPVPDKIHLIRDRVFAQSSSLGPFTPGSAAEKMQAEGARLALFDGAGAPDLLARTASYLGGLSMIVQQNGAADLRYANTTIIDRTGNPHTLKFLVDLMGINPNRIYVKFDPNSPVDIEVYIGLDWARKNSLP